VKQELLCTSNTAADGDTLPASHKQLSKRLSAGGQSQTSMFVRPEIVTRCFSFWTR